MAFWTTERLHQRGSGIFEPFRPQQVVNCQYELRLGSEGYVTGAIPGIKIGLDRVGAQIRIPPGQFALLLSEEIVSIPLNAMALISVRSKYKLLGLINVSGFHVDPGFNGRLIFSVYNAGGNDVVVSRGESMFLMWLSDLTNETKDDYDGEHERQFDIPNSMIRGIGNVAFSPSAMNDRLSDLEHKINNMHSWWRAILVAVVGGILVAALTGNLPVRFGDQAPSVEPTPGVTSSTAPAPIRLILDDIPSARSSQRSP